LQDNGRMIVLGFLKFELLLVLVLS
jgi:hypothetical protein